MKMEWDPAFSTGVGEIDSQHREFISKLNSFGESLDSGVRGPGLRKLLDLAVEYAEHHFFTEETYMMSYAYPGYKTHKKYHEDFKESFEAIRDKMGGEEWKKKDVENLYEKFRGWFVNHIRTRDAELGEFLKNRLTGG